jgi:hypothetical protein
MGTAVTSNIMNMASSQVSFFDQTLTENDLQYEALTMMLDLDQYPLGAEDLDYLGNGSYNGPAAGMAAEGNDYVGPINLMTAAPDQFEPYQDVQPVYDNTFDCPSNPLLGTDSPLMTSDELADLDVISPSRTSASSIETPIDTVIERPKRKSVTSTDTASAETSKEPAKKTRSSTRRKSTDISGSQPKTSSSSAPESTEEQTPAQPEKKRRTRKSRKKEIPEAELQRRRELFLARNREAAYKCRIKKKGQMEEMVEKCTLLDADNAMKNLEKQALMEEVRRLQAQLEPHYLACGDKKLDEAVGEVVPGLLAGGNVELGTVGQQDLQMGSNGNSKPNHQRRPSEAVYEMDFADSLFDSVSRRSSLVLTMPQTVSGASSVMGDILPGDMTNTLKSSKEVEATEIGIEVRS